MVKRDQPDRAWHPYGQLGVYPGGRISVALAATLFDTSPEQARELLAFLVAEGLLTSDGPHYWQIRDRAYAHYAAATLEPHIRRGCVGRLSERALDLAAEASLTMTPDAWRLAPVFTTLEPTTQVSSDRAVDEARAWLEAELDTLVAICRRAHEHGHDRVVWQLADALKQLFSQRKHHDQARALLAVATWSAERLGDLQPLALIHVLTAGLHTRRGQRTLARAYLEHALLLWREADTSDRQGEATILENLAGVLTDPQQARTYAELSRRLHIELGNERGAALLHRRLGDIDRALDHHTRAVHSYTRALDFFDGIADHYQAARALGGLGRSQLDLDEVAQATQTVERLHTAATAARAPEEQAHAHVVRADLAARRGERDAEITALSEALRLYREGDSPNAAPTQTRLTRLERRGGPCG